MESQSTYRVLSIGFKHDILLALRQKFDLRCAIAQDKNADIDWDSLHLMSIPHKAPLISPEMQDCFQALKKHYLQFNDINSRRFYYVTGRESETYNAFILTFYTIYRIIKKHQINLVIHANIPHEGFDFITYQIAQFLNIKTILCYQSLFPSRFWITQKIEDFGRSSINPILHSKENSNYNLPQNWFYMKNSEKDAAYSIKKAAIEILKKPYRAPPALIRYIYAYQFRKQFKLLTQEPLRVEKYIYFPLHLQPELTTSALGGNYSDQLLAIETLSRWLPGDYWIYLKENPKQTEKQRDHFFYKRLRALKNVKLLNKNISSINLIKGSIAVSTVTGTAGWEALFYKKPVLIFGFAWYREFSGVTEYHSSLTFTNFLQNLPASSDILANELDRALQTAGKGIIDDAYQHMVAEFSPKQNAIKVVESLTKYIEIAVNE